MTEAASMSIDEIDETSTEEIDAAIQRVVEFYFLDCLRRDLTQRQALEATRARIDEALAELVRHRRANFRVVK
jgi:hypothetical protein